MEQKKTQTPPQDVDDHMLMPPDESVFRETLEFKENTNLIIKKFQGWSLKEDDDGNLVVKKGKHVMIDEKGINILETSILAVLDKSTVLSNFPNQEEINKHMQSICISLILAMRNNYKCFGQGDLSLLPLILSQFKILAHKTMLRALKGDEKLFMSKTERRTEITRRGGGGLREVLGRLGFK